MTSAQAFAQDIAITARVPAPTPSSPAEIQIVTPSNVPSDHIPAQDGSSAATAIVVHINTVILSGTCTKDSHIEFYDNNTFVGVAPCIGDPTFSIEITLTPGLNKIVALVFNITDDQGPTSSAIYIDYAPTQPQAQPQPTTTRASTPSLTTSFQSLGFLTDQSGSWVINIHEGSPPYTVTVTWGDGTATTYTLTHAGKLTISHVYRKASPASGFVITVTVRDKSGKNSVIQLFTIISKPGSRQAQQVEIANLAMHPSFGKRLKNWLLVAWPAYLIIALMLISFWLGEREELLKLIKNRRLKPPRRK